MHFSTHCKILGSAFVNQPEFNPSKAEQTTHSAQLDKT